MFLTFNFKDVDFFLIRVGFLFIILLGHHQPLELSAVDHSSFDLKLAERVVDLVGAELLPPGHHRVSEPKK